MIKSALAVESGGLIFQGKQLKSVKTARDFFGSRGRDNNTIYQEARTGF